MARLGWIALLGSGETSAAGGQAYETLAAHLGAPLIISVLETPAGFEGNSAAVAGRVVDYLRTRLQNYQPAVHLIPARARNTPFSPDDPAILAPLLTSQLIFAGPGSPSYAVRQLSGSLAWEMIAVRHRLGAALAFASAASVAIGAYALPVYEIYKVGEEPHWKPGLDLLGPYGLSLAIIPHWNNSDGGAELDTSRCFIGLERYRRLRVALPPDASVLGIDEHTSLIIDLEEQTCQVIGIGAVHIECGESECSFRQGEQFPIAALGDFHPLPSPAYGIRPEVWRMALDGEQRRLEEAASLPVIPEEVQQLNDLRQIARSEQDWKKADDLRDRIRDLGWDVQDSAGGSSLILRP